MYNMVHCFSDVHHYLSYHPILCHYHENVHNCNLPMYVCRATRDGSSCQSVPLETPVEFRITITLNSCEGLQHNQEIRSGVSEWVRVTFKSSRYVIINIWTWFHKIICENEEIAAPPSKSRSWKLLYSLILPFTCYQLHYTKDWRCDPLPYHVPLLMAPRIIMCFDYACMYVCMYICMYVCVFICTYILVYLFIDTLWLLHRLGRLIWYWHLFATVNVQLLM